MVNMAHKGGEIMTVSELILILKEIKDKDTDIVIATSNNNLFDIDVISFEKNISLTRVNMDNFSVKASYLTIIRGA